MHPGEDTCVSARYSARKSRKGLRDSRRNIDELVERSVRLASLKTMNMAPCIS